MDNQTVIDLMYQSFRVAMWLTLPILGTAMIVGVVVSVFQSITSIQEQTLVFVPKILGAIAALVVFFPFMLRTIISYTIELIQMLPNVAR